MLHVLGPKNLLPGIERSVDRADRRHLPPVAYVDADGAGVRRGRPDARPCGAGTVLETAAVGLPAVFVPYPHGNGEQARNAGLVVDAGGGIMLADGECTPDWVARRFPALIAHQRPAGRNESGALRGVAAADAATVLATRVLEVIR